MYKKLFIFGLMVILFAGAGGSFAENRYSPEAIKESFTHKNPNIKYQPDILITGMPRDIVLHAFGQPNGSEMINGRIQDVFIFMPDGSKYVNPSPRARNVALGIFTLGTSVAVRQARLAHQRTQLTIYHVYYGLDQKIVHVDVEKGAAFKSPYKTE